MFDTERPQMTSRRDLIKTAILGAAGAAVPAGALAQRNAASAATTWRRGVENQRIADLGDGRFLNPVLAGDYADPTVLKDGDTYYMTNSSYDANPGIVLWRSHDLVNWAPIGPILHQPIGQVWAMDLIKHRGRYYLYIPATPGGRQTVMVMHARRIEGPWSAPIDLNISAIDPGHVVGEDGKRYLFVNGGRRVLLKDDGLATDGPLIDNAYDLWRYPDDWVVEMYAPEGPKFLKRNGYFYLVAAVGGTSGPPTSHMVVVSRSRSVFGPWEQCPHNPIVRTTSADQRWWSRGHATIVEGPGDDWWLVYHGYENGYRTIGRQVLLDPMEWTADGWPRALGGDLSLPLPKPRGAHAGLASFAFSDDFSTNKFGSQWRFFMPSPSESMRARFADGGLVLTGKGSGPADCSPITFTPGDHAYEASVDLDISSGGHGGLLLFYDQRAFLGFGFNGERMTTFSSGQRHDWVSGDVTATRLRLALVHERHVVTMRYSLDGQTWVQHPWQMETSGIHHNVFGGFLSLRPALFSCGAGQATFRDFRYRAL
jgi:xylan 1,4-beta-xylosidase